MLGEVSPQRSWMSTNSMSQNRTRKLSGKSDGFYRQNELCLIPRIFTVILYMFSVSLGAILLSLYYVFIWKNPHTQALDKRVL